MMYLSYISSAQLYIEAAVVGHSGEAGHLTSAAPWCQSGDIMGNQYGNTLWYINSSTLADRGWKMSETMKTRLFSGSTSQFTRGYVGNCGLKATLLFTKVAGIHDHMDVDPDSKSF